MNNVVQNYLKQYASIQHDRRYNKKLLSNIFNKEKPEIAGAFFAAFAREYLYDELDVNMLQFSERQLSSIPTNVPFTLERQSKLGIS